jgi:hypothetical protein
MRTPIDSVPSRRVRFRFNLRTLLVVTTLVAFGLGYLVWRWKEHNHAVAIFESIGGTVTFERPSWAPKWITAIIGDEPLGHVTSVNLHRLPATDEHLQHLSWFPHIRVLALNGSKVTDAGMKHLAGLSKLWCLESEWVDIGDEGLVALRDLRRLEILRVTQSRVTNEGIKRITPVVKNLKELWIDRTQITPEEADAIRMSWPKLQVVYENQGPPKTIK